MEETPLLRRQLRDLAGDRKDLLDKAIKADDVYLRNLGELESVQRRLLEAIEDYDGYLDEHMLWVRRTALFLDTVWFAVELVMVAALVERWLLVTRRRLAYEAAMERREARAQERLAECVPRGSDP